MSDREEDLFVEPMRMWREWYQKSEVQWSESITEVMADERMGKRFGKYFQEWLHAQHMFTEMMGQHLASLNMPSRADVLGVGDRLSAVEDTLSALSADIHQLTRQLARLERPTEMTATAAVKRTRKPPAKAKVVSGDAEKSSDEQVKTDEGAG